MMSDPTQRALQANLGLPADSNGPVFRAPWEAQAFAMALALHEKGLFDWGEWASMLGETIKAAQAAGDPDTGDTYYRHWLATLERMLAEKDVSTRGRSDSLPRCVGACCGSHTAWPTHRAADGGFQGVMRKVFVRLAKAVRPTSKELS